MGKLLDGFLFGLFGFFLAAIIVGAVLLIGSTIYSDGYTDGYECAIAHVHCR